MQMPSEDRIVFWPSILAAFWAALIFTHLHEPGGGPTPALSFLCWLVSALIGAMICMAWVWARAWRRLVSTLILPLSFLVMVFVFAPCVGLAGPPFVCWLTPQFIDLIGASDELDGNK